MSKKVFFMENLSKFAEILGEVMFERNMTARAAAEQIGVTATTVSRYLKGERLPDAHKLVLLADCFSCSTDFLLGREEEDRTLRFLPCPPFSEQLVRLCAALRMSFYAFYHKAGIAESTFFEWKNGTSIPSAASIVRLADRFDRRTDFILGREN